MKKITTLLLTIMLLTASSGETTNNEYKFNGESETNDIPSTTISFIRVVEFL